MYTVFPKRQGSEVGESMEQQLAATQKELAKLKEEYAEYAHMLSHDFLAVFRQIEGLMEIVSAEYAGDWDEKSKKHIDMVVQTSTRGKALVDGLHKYARLSPDSLKVSNVDPQVALNKAVDHLQDLIAQSSAEIKTDLPTIVNADEIQLFELFYQLLHNALTYQHKNIVPKISVIAEERETEWVFSIKDNGIGFSKDSVDDAFRLLNRGVSQTDYPEGVGVGLAIVRKIVNNHDGEVSVADFSSSGTSIQFTLPK